MNTPASVDIAPLLLSTAGSVLAIAVFLALISLGRKRIKKRSVLLWSRGVALFAAYWMTAVLGLQWASVSGAGSPVWPAAGVGVAGLLLGGWRLWPAILIGRLAAAFVTGSDQPIWAEVLIASANTGAAVVAVLILKGWRPADLRLTAMQDVVRLTLAIAAGAAMAAVVGTGVLAFSSELDPRRAIQICFGWWLGNSSGALLVAPIMLTWSYPAAWRMSGRQWLGLVGLLATAALVSHEIFFEHRFTVLRTWYVYPILIWIAVSYRVSGVALALMIVSTAAIWSATIGAGAFATITASALAQVVLAQQFAVITSVAALVLAAAADERRGLEALRHHEARESSIADTAVDPIMVINDRGIIVFCNPAAVRAFGYDRSEMLGQNVSLLMPDPHRSAHDGYLEEYVRTGEARTIGVGRQVEGRRKDGSTFPIDLSVAEWQAGGSRFFTGIMRDQTERVQADNAVRSSERRMSIAIEASGGAIYEQTIPASSDIYVSPQLRDMFGYDEFPVTAEQFDEWVSDQVHPDDRARRDVLREEFLAGREQRFEVELRMRHADGNWIWVRSFAQAIERDGDGRVRRLSGMLIDITERKLAESQVEHLARHDVLTGLSNRSVFADQLVEATQQADVGTSCAALILLDLDDFKSINDTHGHPVGDSILRLVTERLTSSIRTGDSVARLGGDEFAIVVPNARSREGVAELAQRLRHALAQPASINGMELEVSASLGFALYPDDAGTVDLLMRHADLALYEAKKNGRGRVCSFQPELEAAATHHVQVETALRQGIRNNELMLHYQPQVNVETGQVHCVEALVRWCRDGTMIAPDDFIRTAERSNLIRTLGAWVIREACRQQALWRADGIDVKIAVNVSAAEASAEDYVTNLDRAVAEFGVPSETLELEFTEGFLMDPESKQVQSFLRACEARGITLAIDDFGIGYSSLSYLARLPISKIKIDRSFLSEIDLPDEALIEAVVTLGRRLNKRVVAEGVETKAQMDFLSHLGCDDVQGFYLCRPGSAADIEPFLSRSAVPARSAAAG
ncbi:PAS domain S-box-containing protein/diguanylate cyclase (GGDEF) domain-containing protein [Palleronia marisminoris]|uniref:Sensor protein FixL n=1 Tax=Palleronia marisminoris TaxID=315423 RepID=A0A1Y5RBV1_9RHOB|nr:EAL domain-containing protein [Palleronia marisminoris]SFG11362.1 PAS domain S-box-containing protein/diguanylate cyclase (GGDEF) domain-containing protein [Palleronia marisminoris]SLN13675.1 Cyclic di-GMP phosphodiesterase Gmr [Palleronia marisminoris]